MTVYEIYHSAESNSLFRGVSRPDVNKYLDEKSLSVAEYGKGDEICSPLMYEIRMGIILSGKAIISPAGFERRVCMRTIGSGAVFGIPNLYAEGADFPSRITSAANTSVLFISPDSYKALIENNLSAMRNFLRFMSERIIYLNRKIASYTAGSSEKRLAFFLLENAENGIVEPEISMSDIANTLDIGRASLYRALDTLTSLGLISRDEKQIYIKSPEALLEHCCGKG